MVSNNQAARTAVAADGIACFTGGLIIAKLIFASQRASRSFAFVALPQTTTAEFEQPPKPGMMISVSSLLVCNVRRFRRLTGVAIGRTVAILIAAAIAILRAGSIGRAVMAFGAEDGIFLL